LLSPFYPSPHLLTDGLVDVQCNVLGLLDSTTDFLTNIVIQG
jgi:hypothetical protein